MKKTIVALAVAAVAATSANAAVVYNQDGTKVEVGGSVRLLLEKQKEKRTDLINKGSRLEVKASHDLGEGLSALAYGRLDLGDENFNGGATLSKLYAGFKYEGVGTLTFGKQFTNGDDVGVSDYSYLYGGVNKVKATGNKVVRFTSAKWEGFYFGLDYVFGKADKEQYNDRAYVVSAFYDRKFGDVGFAFEAGYSHEKIAESVSQKAFTVGAELSYDKFAIGVDYSQSKKLDEKKKALEVGVKYQVTEKSKVYADFIVSKDGDVKEKGFVFGADYKLHPQVVTFLEVSSFKEEDAKRDTKAGLGLRVFF